MKPTKPFLKGRLLESRLYEQHKINYELKSPPFREDLGGFYV